MKSSAIYTPNAYEVICRVVTIGCLTVLSTIFSYIVAVSFNGGGNRRTQRKPTNLSQVTDKLYIQHNVVSRTPRHERGSNSKL